MDLVKQIIDQNNVVPIELISHNAFNFDRSFYSLYFYPLENLIKDLAINLDKKIILLRSIVYYLFRNLYIEMDIKNRLVKQLFLYVEKSEEIISCIIIMRDQRLAERFLTQDGFSLEIEELVNTFYFSLRYNLPRVSR